MDATFSPAVDTEPLQNSLEPGKKPEGGVVLDELGNGALSAEQRKATETADSRQAALSEVNTTRQSAISLGHCGHVLLLPLPAS